MSVIDASLVVAVVGVVVTLIWFILIAYLNPAKFDFFFANQSLDAGRVRANLAATATSLAGAIFFFLNATPLFGWIMLLIPAFNAAGIVLFLWLVREETPDPKNTGSVFRFLYHRTGSPLIAKHCNYVVVLNFITIFVIEIIIGSQIFAYFVTPIPSELLTQLGAEAQQAANTVAQDINGGATQTVSRMVGALFLSAVVLWYVWKGGFAAVSQTDKWQFALIASGFTFALLSIGYSWITADGQTQDVVELFKRPQLGTDFQMSFLVNLVFINLLLPMTQISTWQRYSSGPRDEVIKGFVKGIWQNILPLWYAVILLAALLYLSTGKTGFIALFHSLRVENVFASLFVFPLLFVGLVAALLSTADSMLIAIMLAVHDGRDGAKRSQESSDVIAQPSGKELFVTGIAVVLAALITGVVISISEDFNKTVTQLLFAGYGMPCLLFPIIAMRWSRTAKVTARLLWAVVGLWTGMVILWVSAIYGMVTGDFRSTHLGPVVGICLVAVAVLFARRPRSGRSIK